MARNGQKEKDKPRPLPSHIFHPSQSISSPCQSSKHRNPTTSCRKQPMKCKEGDGAAEESAVRRWNWRESTAKGMFSRSGLHVLCMWATLFVYSNARSTAETVGMYAVLLRARSHVSPMSWQSRPIILLSLLLSPVPGAPFSYIHQKNIKSVQTFTIY